MGSNDTSATQSEKLFRSLVALALLAGFASLVAVMMRHVDVKDGETWTRMSFVYSSVHAIVLTAIGWIFGHQGHRDVAAQASKAAETAQAAAATAALESKANRDKAEDSSHRVAKLEAKVAAAIAIMEKPEPPTTGRNADPSGGDTHEGSLRHGDAALAILRREI
jgi:hypothetical protein